MLTVVFFWYCTQGDFYFFSVIFHTFLQQPCVAFLISKKSKVNIGQQKQEQALEVNECHFFDCVSSGERLQGPKKENFFHNLSDSVFDLTYRIYVILFRMPGSSLITGDFFHIFLPTEVYTQSACTANFIQKIQERPSSVLETMLKLT